MGGTRGKALAGISLAVGALLAACSATDAPAPTLDIQATVEAGVAATIAAQVVPATPTPVPTPTPKPTATATSQPTATPFRRPTATPTPRPTPTPRTIALRDLGNGEYESSQSHTFTGPSLRPGGHRLTWTTFYWDSETVGSITVKNPFDSHSVLAHFEVGPAPRGETFSYSTPEFGRYTYSVSVPRGAVWRLVVEFGTFSDGGGGSSPSPDSSFGNGTHVVGVDIQPGTYRSEGTEGCYWARLSGFSGELSDIIANFFGDGPQVVTIQSSDAGFESSGCGTWSKD